MIYAELAGGLGNQMFIYAFARALGLRCGEPVTLLDRQDWRDGAPAHTVCALDALNISPDVKIIADAGFAKAHLPRRNAAKALMIKYEQRRGLMARDWHSFEAAAAPLLNAVGLHFATDGYPPARRGHARDFLAWGYFQSERYFADFAPIIKEELRANAAPAGPYAAQITAAGSVFIGPWSPESAGDYASGTNHTLPTGGWARAYSGVNTDSFLRKITYQELSRKGLATLSPTVIAMAEAEGLGAHAAAVRVRMKGGVL